MLVGIDHIIRSPRNIKYTKSSYVHTYENIGIFHGSNSNMHIILSYMLNYVKSLKTSQNNKEIRCRNMKIK